MQIRTAPSPSSARGLVHRRLERAEAVPAMDERDRQARRVLEAERPVERGVAAADDDAGLVLEDLLAPDEVMEPAPLPVVDVLDLELAGLERPVPGGDDQHARRERLALVGGEDEVLLAVRADALKVLDLLVEEDLGSELEPLLRAEVDERLGPDLGMAGDVVDVLLRVDRGGLAAELAEALDDADGGVTMPRVVRRREADGACADDRDVDDVVVAHRALRLPARTLRRTGGLGGTLLVDGVRWSFRGKDAGSVRSGGYGRD